ncbi:hypothetical protein BC829DRAFT_182106 [Chytridium lagenaria]|nr:hypothetical protein BC829DRAFT_182106 [Chytridium lagenaria]
MNTVSSGFFETHYRKTYFKDVIHVRSLLRKVSLAPGIMAKDSQTLHVLLPPKGRQPSHLVTRSQAVIHLPANENLFHLFQNARETYGRYCMMTLFTYFVLVAQLYMLLDKNAQLSCVLGCLGRSHSDLFHASGLAGQFTGTQNFGAGLADTLADLSSQIKDQVGGTVVDDMFDMLLGVWCRYDFEWVLLVYNIFDFCLNVRKDLGKLRKEIIRGLMIMGRWRRANAVQFMGTQIGFAYMGSLYLMTILLIINFMLALFIKYAFFRDLVWKFILQNGLFFVSLAVSIILSMAQKFIVEAFFVAKIGGETRGTPGCGECKDECEGTGGDFDQVLVG